ncbi:glutamine amidotransferase [Clostridium botulinum]|uniref:type 1 glutamine amidotransferase family protein n=1 Tax=unclassified Clostridium TaxID=2614128 RepID=UPI0005041C88|nr:MULTISPECIES: type 1 glutamine amidotransferase family protein [unclassified Clostridium]KFX54673.1 glutamine amidotransferase [Clostridium botulinum]MBY6780466.1 glutamine amidotransferase [Clostridium botulinum]MBY6853585.1 glutamine amidotransferase [Clostridium botulinum]MBY7009157.1 glutamine amidotransferase [Clostridium botulinum]NFH74031.1 glutamine amidotransferase [Clostridium botulinum]
MQGKKVYLYVFNTMSDWEYGYLTAELNSGRYFKKDLAPLKVVTVGANKEIITTMGGLSIKPDISFNECTLESKDLLVLPGGNTWGEDIHQPILKRVGQALELGTIIAAICGAIEALANAGYLDSRKHTSNSLEYTKMVCPNYKGEKFYEMGSVVASENLITASGVAPLEFAMEVLKKLDVFAPETLHSWYYLNKTHKPEYFFQLMNSINS